MQRELGVKPPEPKFFLQNIHLHFNFAGQPPRQPKSFVLHYQISTGKIINTSFLHIHWVILKITHKQITHGVIFKKTLRIDLFLIFKKIRVVYYYYISSGGDVIKYRASASALRNTRLFLHESQGDVGNIEICSIIYMGNNSI